MLHNNRDKVAERINLRFALKFDLGQNISIEVASLCLGVSNVLRLAALDIDEISISGGGTTKAIERLEEANKHLLDRIRAV